MNLKELAPRIHEMNRSKGFWDNERTLAEVGLLICSEISEAVEALRKGDQFSSKDESVKEFDFELADVLIRCMDAIIGFDLDANCCDFETDSINDEDYELDFNEVMQSLWEVSGHVADMISQMDQAEQADDESAIEEASYCVGGDFASICYELFGTAFHRGVNLLTVIQRKLEINEIRPRLHGKQF
jgi:NTP pyrophosphatase (non-canonical NTP hydrolase)